MTLLIVDDNIKWRQYIKSLFGEKFTSIYECEDGIYAADVYEKLNPSWVLMDLRMEKMDGITALRSIIEKFPLAKIIILSDFTGEQLQAEAKNSGAVAYVPKEELHKIDNIIFDHN